MYIPQVNVMWICDGRGVTNVLSSMIVNRGAWGLRKAKQFNTYSEHGQCEPGGLAIR